MVLGSQSQPLDVGRTKRLVTPALLAALWARDKGCTFPGCGRPPQWSDAHHVKHWVDGGPTALLNLALLCAFHHTWVHQRDLTATVTAIRRHLANLTRSKVSGPMPSANQGSDPVMAGDQERRRVALSGDW